MRIYLRLLRYLRPYLGRLLLAVACGAIFGAANFVSLGLIAPLMSVIFERAPAGTVVGTEPVAAGPVTATLPLPGPSTLGPHPRKNPVFTWPAPVARIGERWFLGVPPHVALQRIGIVLLVVFLVKNIADYLHAFLTAAVEQGVICDLRSDLQRHLQRLSLSFFHGRRTGALISRVTNDMEYVRGALAASISNLVKDVFTLAGALVWVVATSWQLALNSIVIVPVVALTLTVVGRRMRKRSGRAQEEAGNMTAVLQESIANARVVRAFGMEDYERRKFDRANEDFRRHYVQLRRAFSAAGPVSEFAFVMVAVAMLWLAGREIFERHTLAPGAFTLFVGALLATVSPIRRLAEVNAGLQQGLAAAQRIFSMIDTPPAVVDRPGVRSLPPLADAIRYERVGFAYQPGRPVLEDVSFEIRCGEVVALVGSSGAGKSTAMDLLARLYDPTGGRITFDGVDLREGTLDSLRAQLGIVTQDTFLFHDTVRANIAYGIADARDEAVRAAAVTAHAHAFISRLPQGYDTVVGERGLKLSGGERQRLAIARALLKDPRVLLLDEATSALDTESERMVQEALERLMHGRTVLVIAHRLSTILHADRVVVLDRGRVVECGVHGQLIERDGVYRRLYDLQFQGPRSTAG